MKKNPRPAPTYVPLGNWCHTTDISNLQKPISFWKIQELASPLLTDGKRRSIAPTNHLRVSKRGQGVEGQYVLDLSLPPPPSSAPGILSDQDRKNLSLYTTSGSIDAEIWIIHDGAMSGKPKRAHMELFTDNGVVRAIVVRSRRSPAIPLVVKKNIQFTIARSLLHQRKQPCPSSFRPERARLLWRCLCLTSSLLPRAYHHQHRRRQDRILSCARRIYVAAFGCPGLPGIFCRQTTTHGEVG